MLPRILFHFTVIGLSFSCMKTIPGETPTTPSPTVTTTTVITTTTKAGPTEPCQQCTADDVELLEGDQPVGPDDPTPTLPVASDVTIENGCAAMTVTCEVPDGQDGIALMEFNDQRIGNPAAPDRVVTAPLVCQTDGTWQFTFEGTTITVDKIFCVYYAF